MNSSVMQWAVRHNVSERALAELRLLWGLDIQGPRLQAGAVSHTEAYIQSIVRLEAARKGVKLWRNNVGALFDSRGVPVRYGLANDSKQLNEHVKSGDLIGWRSILITPALVGSRIAQFVSRECKRPDWYYTGDDHERAQLKWIEAINADGGDAQFCNGEGTL